MKLCFFQTKSSIKKLIALLCIISISTFIILYSYSIHSTHLSVQKTKSNDTVFKIDWINYDFIEHEKQQNGPGEKGLPVFLDNPDELKLSAKLVREFSYNVIASDKISLNRSLPDSRNEQCSVLKYRSDLPSVSVIIVFHDEYLSFLLRTVHSVLNRSPSKLIEEVILVDDMSTKSFLCDELDDYVKENFNKNKVWVLRLTERHGLMRARMAGIRAAKANIVVVMDAHIEVNTNWLPPLIEPIFEDNHTLTQPMVDYIDWNTLSYNGDPNYKGDRGGFNWGLTYTQYTRYITPGEKVIDNYPVPAILGAIVAMNKNYFFELGGYDPGCLHNLMFI